MNKTYPRDVFLYLLSIITMVTITVSFGILLFQYINIQYPDILSEGYYWSQSSMFDSIRNSMAILIVVFPVFVWVSWFLRRDLNNNPEKKELRIRRWLLYLTLFAASLVIIGDLVALLMNFLNGELTARFGLKILTIFLIAGSVFAHYFSELRDKAFSWMPIFDKALIVLVVAGIISGFWFAGSPAQQRVVRLDERRISDLSLIQSSVITYWQGKQKLPQNLTELSDGLNRISVPNDPESGESYVYKVTGARTFELCATFKTSNITELNGKYPSPVYYGAEENWEHKAGDVCFERVIDPDFYPPLKQ